MDLVYYGYIEPRKVYSSMVPIVASMVSSTRTLNAIHDDHVKDKILSKTTRTLSLSKGGSLP